MRRMLTTSLAGCGIAASRELALARVDALNPSLHAVVELSREAAQQRAAAADEAWREANPRDCFFEPLWPGVPSVATGWPFPGPPPERTLSPWS